MVLLGEFRQKVGVYILDRKGSRSKRKVHYSNIESVKKIGIVWDASNNEELAVLSQFHRQLNEKDI
ncbi:MAG TPA: hypothetical protein PLZ75_10160, partial [Bacteroidales bacterium]|nr:hypothetical protein [Bacteroidales bacterium]